MSTRTANKFTVGAVGWLLSLSLSAFLVGGPLTVLLPFEPYRLVGYEIVPQTVCPGQPVSFVYQADIVKQPLASIQVGDPEQLGDEAIRTQAQWVKVAVLPDGTQKEEKKLEPETYPSDFTGRYGERRRVSGFARYAPNEPGMWRQDITVFVRGRQALREVVQVVPTFSTNPVHVKEFTACR